MRILLDNGIFSHSEFAESAVRQTSVRWGNTDCVSAVHGVVRKAPDKNVKYQKQKEALFTVGRLIRTGLIEAYSYSEIKWERLRDKIGLGVCNALRGCRIHSCRPPVNRLRLRKTVDLTDAISKGGKKDTKAGVALGSANQLAFLKWLCARTKGDIELLTSDAALIGLSEFEIESLRNVQWFQFLCDRSGSAENYVDVFHLWTAERNGLDALLTLDNGLTNLVSRVRSEKNKTVAIRTDVLRPLDLLRTLGIDEPDPVPLEADRFYYLHEVEE
jgi:hypothetical protein